MNKIIILILSLIHLTSAAPFLLSEDTNLFSENIYFYIDTTASQNIDDIERVQLKGKFSPANPTINLGYTTSALWLKMTVKNNTEKSGKWLFEIGVPSLHHVTFYYPDKRGGYKTYESGLVVPRKIRENSFTNPVLPLELARGDQVTFFTQILSESALTFPVFLHSESDFLFKERNVQTFLGFYFGALFVIIVFSFFIFIKIGTKYYLYYILFIGGLAIGQMLLVYGNAFDYFSFVIPGKLLPFLSLASFISAVFGVIFSRCLLNSYRYTPVLDRILKIVCGLTVISGTVSVFISFSWSAKLLGIVNIVASFILMIVAIISCKKGYKPSMYYLFAGTLSLLGFILYNLMYTFDIVPFSIALYFLPNVGVIATAILLPVAIVQKVKLSEEQKRKAQIQLIDEQQKSMSKLKELNSALERFVPTRFLSLLGRNNIAEVSLGDQCKCTMTVLFSDIRSFSTISEQLSPTESFEFLNQYLSGIGPVVRKHGGFIDKYYGDGIMALFPDNAADAVSAAIEIQKYVETFNDRFSNSKYRCIQTGIGIHTGKMILGTIGEDFRMDGTVISDAVNLSSRLENLTKKFKTSIIISQNVVDALSNFSYNFKIRMLGTETVRGRKEETIIYEILDSLPEDLLKIRCKNTKTFQKGVKLFYTGQTELSIKYFQQCLKTDPQDFASILFLNNARSSNSKLDFIDATIFTNKNPKRT
ncbi:7TM-DISM domain-containing protein [Chitinispirillales bacterium ANBcel5]|uniref:7TM-DISM domain-containing protein n=1 Tax=Cellulosispirillum alkaliphilum TaxID=3039283 RepID=UPI002A4EFA34|nr:7TM-DISM domain-containing protein [Chitinispirillales bacterium ANBcel5]